ncbi:hypothetical protein J3A65_002089 [Rhizobium sp. PvP014]|nr:hypothetical protein [Rhizobium sp. PvP014]MBP2528721.1 hypothetical protein [Rhizobium sp. PvP099]
MHLAAMMDLVLEEVQQNSIGTLDLDMVLSRDPDFPGEVGLARRRQ